MCGYRMADSLHGSRASSLYASCQLEPNCIMGICRAIIVSLYFVPVVSYLSKCVCVCVCVCVCEYYAVDFNINFREEALFNIKEMVLTFHGLGLYEGQILCANLEGPFKRMHIVT